MCSGFFFCNMLTVCQCMNRRSLETDKKLPMCFGRVRPVGGESDYNPVSGHDPTRKINSTP